MPRPKREMRNGQLLCPGCEKWLHPSRFSPNTTRENGGGTTTTFRKRCRSCEQSIRNDLKNEDRALAIVKGRAREEARKSSVTLEFFMEDLNWKSLTPMVQAYLDNPETALCPNCGHPYLNERDFQLDHRAPPRHPQDWARHHARNIGPLDCSCNAGKNDKQYEYWLDEQEDVRLSVASYYGLGPAEAVRPIEVGELGQTSLFGDLS